MNIFVSGGAGFIGSHAVERLLEGGATVTVYDDFSSGKRANLPVHPALRVVEGDIGDLVSVRQAMAGAERVLHLAAQVSVQASLKEPAASCRSNVLGFVNILQAAVECGAKRLVYASSAAVYGAPATLPLDEEAAPAPLSPYGLEKLIDDQYAALFASLHGLSSLGLRYFNVYGPRQDPASPYAGVISRFADRYRAGEPLRVFGDGEQTRDFIYVGDVARITAAALAHDATGVCNVGTGGTVRLLDLIAALENIGGHPATVVHEAPQSGDIRDSATSIARQRALFGEMAFTPLMDGLKSLLEGASC
jgi:UDP-glucose 4-epimerase